MISQTVSPRLMLNCGIAWKRAVDAGVDRDVVWRGETLRDRQRVAVDDLHPWRAADSGAGVRDKRGTIDQVLALAAALDADRVLAGADRGRVAIDVAGQHEVGADLDGARRAGLQRRCRARSDISRSPRSETTRGSRRAGASPTRVASRSTTDCPPPGSADRSIRAAARSAATPCAALTRFSAGKLGGRNSGWRRRRTRPAAARAVVSW